MTVDFLPASRWGRRVRVLPWAAGFAFTLAAASAGPAGAFCFDQAARRYDLSPVLVQSIAEQESGLDPNAAGWNPDGSVDVGLMQINSGWEGKLGRERWIGLCTDPCYNVMIGAWILADCIYRYGYTVDGIGCYNAKSPEKRAKYTRQILNRVNKKWERPKKKSDSEPAALPLAR